MKHCVLTILEEWLKENNFDGLVNEFGECGCLRSDLAPCSELCLECEPAYNTGPRNGCDFYMSKSITFKEGE